MPTSPASRVLGHIRGAVPSDGDGELLGRFVERRDEAALAALVHRHGPMVWGVCRRLLNHHDAEDAFQAAFIVLVRKAASVSPRGMVGNWLHGVARQAALQARSAARRRARERQVTDMPDAEAPQDRWADVRPVLDEELSRLPDRYRAVIVLCDLESRTRREVARQLGCPEGTVGSRLARAREMLARRLTQRGIVLSGGALAVLSRSAAGMPPAIKAVGLIAAGETVIPVKVAALAEGVLKAMLLAKLKAAVAVVLVLGLVCCVPGLTLLRGHDVVAVSVSHATAAEAGGKKGDEKPRGEKAGPKGAAELLRDRSDVRQAERELTAAGLDVEVARARFFPRRDGPGYRAFDPKYLSFLPDTGDWTVPLVSKGAIRAEYASADAAQLESLANYLRVILAAYPEVLGRGALVEEPVEQDEKVTAWGQEVGGLKLGLAADAHTVRQGEKARFVVKLRNVGKADIKVTYVRLRERPPTVTGAGGGRVTVAMPPSPRYYAPIMERALKPDETVILYGPEIAVQPEALMRLDGIMRVDTPTICIDPGKYKVAFGGMLTSHPKLATGTVEFEVKPPADKQQDARSEYTTADVVVQYRDATGREVRDLKQFRVDDAETVAELASHFPGILGERGSGPRTSAGKRATFTIKFNHKSGEASQVRVAHVTSDYATWWWRDNTPYTGDRQVKEKERLQSLMERLAVKHKVDLK